MPSAERLLEQLGGGDMWRACFKSFDGTSLAAPRCASAGAPPGRLGVKRREAQIISPPNTREPCPAATLSPLIATLTAAAHTRLSTVGARQRAASPYNQSSTTAYHQRKGRLVSACLARLRAQPSPRTYITRPARGRDTTAGLRHQRAGELYSTMGAPAGLPAFLTQSKAGGYIHEHDQGAAFR